MDDVWCAVRENAECCCLSIGNRSHREIIIIDAWWVENVSLGDPNVRVDDAKKKKE